VSELLKYQPSFSTKQTQAFLGKATYYKKFVKDFAQIALPLYEFIKIKNNKQWS
jgi:hypothetical protein